MNSPETIIQVDGLTARFGEDTILQNVSFTVRRGEVVVIAGGSGCGKSTLLKHMIGLHELAAGRVTIDGVDITMASEAELNRLRQNIGVTFQSGALLGSLSIMENILLPLMDFTDLTRQSAEKVAKMKLALVGLGGYENHLPSEISGGMMKRAGLARSLALDPVVLFFDEPSAGLDPVTSAELDLLINSLNAGLGTTMVIVTHELASIFNIAHRVIMLDKSAKGIIAQGPPEKLKNESTDERVVNFFRRKAPEER